MKVAFLSLLPEQGAPHVSGVPAVSRTLLSEFETLDGIRVDAVSLVDGLKEPRIVQSGRVCYHYLPCKAHGKTWTFYRRERAVLAAYLDRLEPDVVHGQPTSEYLLAAVTSGRPHVITLHGLPARESGMFRRWSLHRLTARIRDSLQRKAVAKAKNLIVISDYIIPYIQSLTRARLWAVPNPIGREFFSLPPVDRQGLRILCVGTVGWRKNQAVLVEACRLMREAGMAYSCRIVGQWALGHQEVLRRIAGYGLSPHISVEGIVAQDKLLDAYAWSNFVVLPSGEETSPLSLIQGMAGGRCVAGANAAGIPSLLQQGKYGRLFDADRAESLLQVFRSFASSPEDFWATAAQARIMAQATHSPGAVARKTVEIYLALVAEGKTRCSPT